MNTDRQIGVGKPVDLGVFGVRGFKAGVTGVTGEGTDAQMEAGDETGDTCNFKVNIYLSFFLIGVVHISVTSSLLLGLKDLTGRV